MPALPKHSSTRARRNRVAGARTLSAVHDVETPELPELDDVEWHHMTTSWWNDIWASPMAPEYDDSDVHGLYALALLVNAFWYQPSTTLASEIRLQRQCFGLTPIDRRRLQWEIDRGEEASTQTQKRRNEAAVRDAKHSAPPAKSAGKAVWVEWIAAHRNLPAVELAKLSKPELLKRYGPDAKPTDARDLLAN